MSNIPHNREDLVRLIDRHFATFQREFETVDDAGARKRCDEDFTVKDVVAIRLWWTRAVMRWIKEGQQGKTPVIPAAGHSLQRMRPLHADIAAESRDEAYPALCRKMVREKNRLLNVIDGLTDGELTKVGRFEWARRWPLMRWISVATSSQYDSGRKLIRKAVR